MNYDTLPRLPKDLWLAGVLLTRLPLPMLPDHAFAEGARAAWAYAIIGIVVAAIGGVLGSALLASGLTAAAAAGLVLASLMVMTGAMHEDGLADVADGFWGGASPRRRLDIMKDSRIGAFGVLALLVVTGLRWLALATLLPYGIATLIAAAALSRAMMPVVMHLLPHARNDGLSRSVGRPPARAVLAGVLLATAISGLLLGVAGLLAIVIAAGITLAVGTLAKAKVGGQTGDVLGCTQVLSETAVLLFLSAFIA